jgi:hypothetical protein
MYIGFYTIHPIMEHPAPTIWYRKPLCAASPITHQAPLVYFAVSRSIKGIECVDQSISYEDVYGVSNAAEGRGGGTRTTLYPGD